MAHIGEKMNMQAYADAANCASARSCASEYWILVLGVAILAASIFVFVFYGLVRICALVWVLMIQLIYRIKQSKENAYWYQMSMRKADCPAL